MYHKPNNLSWYECSIINPIVDQYISTLFQIVNYLIHETQLYRQIQFVDDASFQKKMLINASFFQILDLLFNVT